MNGRARVHGTTAPARAPGLGPARVRAARRGLTLLELALVMAVLAILGALAVPSMAARLRTERLQTAAEMLVADIADARHEAARRGRALHVEARVATAEVSASGSGPDSGSGGGANPPAWCWSVATAPACPCGTASAACRLKSVPALEHPGVHLVSSQPVMLQPDGQASPVLAAVFAGGDRQLHVQVSRFGRARVCDPAGASNRVPRC